MFPLAFKCDISDVRNEHVLRTGCHQKKTKEQYVAADMLETWMSVAHYVVAEMLMYL